MLILLAFVVQTTSAQLTKDLGEFSTIKIYDRLTVSLISSSENKIVITGNRKEVEVVNNNGELKLRMPFLNYYQVKIFPLNCISKIESIAASEGSYVSVKLILSKLLWI
jgi:hypothetical protein